MKSLLDTDFYTFTVGAAVHANFPNMEVEYEFRCRDEGVRFDESFMIRFKRALHACHGIKFSHDEISYLISLDCFSPCYIDFLREFTFRPSLFINSHLEDDHLVLRVKGPISSAIFYEVPVLALINQCYFDSTEATNFEVGRKILREKIELIAADNKNNVLYPIHFLEFGTRRRRSFDWQREVYLTLRDALPTNIIGTSNVLLAKELGERPRGTQSHQWYQIFQATGGLKDSIKRALDTWLITHRGRFAVALTDIVGSKAFFREMDPLHYKAFDGYRGDSGNNHEWLELLRNSLRDASINPQTKDAYLSNALDVPQSLRIHNDWKGQFSDLVFAIGTKFTNHFDRKALNIVIKLCRVNGMPVAKISDDVGKGICTDQNFLTLLQNTFSNERS